MPHSAGLRVHIPKGGGCHHERPLTVLVDVLVEQLTGDVGLAETDLVGDDDPVVLAEELG